jgi:hypothetical protein
MMCSSFLDTNESSGDSRRNEVSWSQADLARRESRDDLETVHSCQGEWLAQERLEEEHR